jgi:hypothetical protein
MSGRSVRCLSGGDCSLVTVPQFNRELWTIDPSQTIVLHLSFHGMNNYFNSKASALIHAYLCLSRLSVHKHQLPRYSLNYRDNHGCLVYHVIINTRRQLVLRLW